MDAAAIKDAAAMIRDGQLVAFATETVYGLGGDATNADAVAAIFAAKGRPSFNPLISHVAETADAAKLGIMDARADALAAKFWPGPLTLVLPKTSACPVAQLTTAGLDSIAVRVPSAPMARDFIAAAGVPIAAPSANPPSPARTKVGPR